ncbi:hypothetical protein EXE58_06115 [Nocardioides seonyuensis]|uniref:PD-(D/E)XK nuclease superfamily protein n=1 Tax=Nocardioides seonyuensis TaxID=2518371 RepID=A0A4P7IH48_9ACTN|nr:hypothetical protein [Nocardioides seonyuensis]QBX55071.1 hypothetical protein EXE58_06115 [Nocardioides seonyuensis]
MQQPLLKYGTEVGSVFDLLGRGEVDLTAALGWTLTVSPALRASLWRGLGMPGNPDDVSVSLESADAEGRTDLELQLGSQALVVVEAKKGWLQPGETQLGKYVGRFSGVERALLVSLSDSSLDWAARELPTEVGGAPVVHLPWDAVRESLRAIRRDKSARGHTERLWLTQFTDYLKGATAVRQYDSQWVYVVSISKTRLGSLTFREYVLDEEVYFHPFGKNWPRRPPILMGFRWDGKLQQVNRVETATVLPALQDRWPDIPLGPEKGESYGPHAVYDLGPKLRVPEIPSGNIVMARRAWVLLDQLLTEPTIEAAEKSSKALQEAAR